MPSRFGSERTLAASHQQENQLVTMLLRARILSKSEVFVQVAISMSCLGLTYVEIPSLQPPLLEALDSAWRQQLRQDKSI